VQPSAISAEALFREFCSGNSSPPARQPPAIRVHAISDAAAAAGIAQLGEERFDESLHLAVSVGVFSAS